MPDVLLCPVPLDSGYTALVRPLPPFLRPHLMRRATEKYPDPDPEPYRQPLQNAFVEGLKENADDNPKYIEDLTEARKKRIAYMYELVVKSDVVAGTEEATREKLIEHFKPYLSQLRNLGTDVPADEWQAVVMFSLIASEDDAVNIAEAALQRVTKEGIRRAGDSFRR